MAIQSINPATGEILESFDELTEEQVETKLKLATETFRSYRKTSFEKRAVGKRSSTQSTNSAAAFSFNYGTQEGWAMNACSTGTRPWLHR